MVVALCAAGALGGCAPGLFARPAFCEHQSPSVSAAFRHRSLSELTANVSALAVDDRLDAYVYGTQCIHPPMEFLVKTLVSETQAREEAFRRIAGELTDFERFAYMELIGEIHRTRGIDLNSDIALRTRVSDSLSSFSNRDTENLSRRLFKEVGVQF